jgi:pseudaminic acid cytidylyltransferase
VTTGNIAVIPARGGSKRIPRKNIRNFCGRPMIAWPIEAAKGSELFDRIIVSTDDAEIADVARQCGAEVPFVRPAKLADDFVGTTDVIAHAAAWALEWGWHVTAVCCIYATAPLLLSDDLLRGFSALRSRDWNYAFSATEFTSTIFRAMRWVPEGGVQMIFPEHALTRSQDLPITLHDAGQFYWGATHAWLAKARIFSESSIPVLIPQSRSQDIDTEEDWIRAESLFRSSMGHSIKGI